MQLYNTWQITRRCSQLADIQKVGRDNYSCLLEVVYGLGGIAVYVLTGHL